MAEIDHFDLGDAVELAITFKVNNALTDPAVVTATAVSPSGVETIYTYGTSSELSKTSVGVYGFTFVPTEVGTWYVILAGSGGGVTGKERSEFIIDPRLPSDALSTVALTTVEKAERYLGQQGISVRSTERDQDLDIAEAINAYSQAINDYCNRRFKPAETAVSHTFTYRGNRFMSIAPFELRAVTSIVVYSDDTVSAQWTLSSAAPPDYILMPREKSLLGTYTWIDMPSLYGMTVDGDYLHGPPWGREPAVTITGNWGPTSVPAAVERACLIAVANNLRSPEGFASRTLGPLGLQEGVEAFEAPGQSLPVDARALLQPYRLRRDF